MTGYKIYSREQGQQYDYEDPAWEGTDLYSTFHNLDENKSYCFVVRVFDTYGYESEDSNEVCLNGSSSEGLPGNDSISNTIIERGSFDVLDYNQISTVAYSNQDIDGTVTIEDGGATLHMEGNRWRRTEQVYDITPDTVLEFDFMSTTEGEIQGIGFDEDDNLTNHQRIFQFFGTQTWSAAYQWSPPYTATDMGSYVHFSIPVGQYYTGSNMSLVFVNDDDGAVSGNSWFKNVRIYNF